MAQFPIGPLTLSLTQCALERTETGTRDTTVAAVITETTVRNRFTRLIHNLAGSSGCSKRIGLAAVRNRNKQTVHMIHTDSSSRYKQQAQRQVKATTRPMVQAPVNSRESSPCHP